MYQKQEASKRFDRSLWASYSIPQSCVPQGFLYLCLKHLVLTIFLWDTGMDGSPL